MIDDEVHLLLGAYVLGGLSSNDRRAFEEHLPTCARCRGELAEVAGVPGLLRRADAVPLLPDGSHVDHAGVNAVLARARRGGVTARRARMAVAAVAACAVAVAAAIGIPRLHHGATPGPRAALVIGADDHMRGEVTMTRKAWGTSLDIELSGMPRNGTFTLRATDSSGHAEPAATWSATASGTMDVIGATSIPIGQLTSFQVLGQGGRVLASAHV